MPSNWTGTLLLPLGLLILCLTENSASGSCGDYLHTRIDRPASSSHESQPSDRPGSDVDKAAGRGSDLRQLGPFATLGRFHRSQKMPCSGPGCRSNRERFPNPHSPLAVELTVPAKAVWSTDALPKNTESISASPAIECLDRHRGYLARVERPPQQSA